MNSLFERLVQFLSQFPNRDGLICLEISPEKFSKNYEQLNSELAMISVHGRRIRIKATKGLTPNTLRGRSASIVSLIAYFSEAYELHRDSGPAVYIDGMEFYFLNNNVLTYEEWLVNTDALYKELI